MSGQRRKTVVLVTDLRLEGKGDVQVYADLRTVCRDKDWNENKLYRMKMPFNYEEYWIERQTIKR